MINNLPYPSIERIIEKTDFKSEAIAKAALATLKWLDHGAPELWEEGRGLYRFDMCKFSGLFREEETPEQAETCGTVCCIAGAMHGYLKHSLTDPFEQQFRMISLFNQADRRDNMTLYKLFYPNSHRGDIYNATPAEAAETLRLYLFTGEVKWSFEND